MSELVSADGRQDDLFSTISTGTKTGRLMEVIDQVNDRMGTGTIRLASEGIKQSWSMRRERKSQNYTTDWDELLCVH